MDFGDVVHYRYLDINEPRYHSAAVYLATTRDGLIALTAPGWRVDLEYKTPEMWEPCVKGRCPYFGRWTDPYTAPLDEGAIM